MVNLRIIEKRWVGGRWRLGFLFFSVNKIEFEWWYEMMMRGSKWTKEYFMLDFNFRSNHKCGLVWVRRDNISKMKSGVSIGWVHQFFGFKNQKARTKPNQNGLSCFVGFVWTAYIPSKLTWPKQLSLFEHLDRHNIGGMYNSFNWAKGLNEIMFRVRNSNNL